MNDIYKKYMNKDLNAYPPSSSDCKKIKEWLLENGSDKLYCCYCKSKLICVNDFLVKYKEING